MTSKIEVEGRISASLAYLRFLSRIQKFWFKVVLLSKKE